MRFNGARFNHCQDDFKNWYLRRRSQLLRDRHLASQSETVTKPGKSELRSDKIESDQFYLNERKKILRKDFGNTHFSFASESESGQLDSTDLFSMS